MNVEFLMSARQRLIYEGQTTLTGALLEKPDNDGVVSVIEQCEELQRGKTKQDAANAVELLIAKLVDDGQTLPVTNQEGFEAARWIAQVPLAELPDPMPRPYALYLAAAYKESGTFPTLTAALTEIFKNRTFG